MPRLACPLGFNLRFEGEIFFFDFIFSGEFLDLFFCLFEKSSADSLG